MYNCFKNIIILAVRFCNKGYFTVRAVNPLPITGPTETTGIPPRTEKQI